MRNILLSFMVLAILASCDETQRPSPSDADNSSGPLKSNEQKVNILAMSSGRYLTCDTEQNLKIIGNKDTTMATETFILVNLGGDKIALKAFNGKYVCADQNKNYMLSADRKDVLEWETFTMKKLNDNKVAFIAFNNRYVCCDRELKSKLVANRNSRGEWETFKIIYK